VDSNVFALAIAFRSSGNGSVLWTIGAVVGVVLFYRGFRLLARRRLILNTPTAKIRSASMGLVEVNGLAVGPYTINAPIAGVPCFYSRTTAWQLKKSGKNRSWEKVAEENLHVPFYLDDNTGRVLVRPQGAELDIHRDFCQEYGNSLFSSQPYLPANVSGFLTRHDVSAETDIKVEEYCIKPKNALFILGTLAENPGPESSAIDTAELAINGQQVRLPQGLTNKLASVMNSLPGATHTVIVTAQTDGMKKEVSWRTDSGATGTAGDVAQQEKIKAALTKAGITNPAAWATAGVGYAGVTPSPTAVIEATATATAEEFDPNPKTVLMKGKNNPAFFISWRSQREVVETLGWKATLMIWGGPALTLLSVYVLAAQYGWL